MYGLNTSPSTQSPPIGMPVPGIPGNPYSFNPNLAAAYPQEGQVQGYMTPFSPPQNYIMPAAMQMAADLRNTQPMPPATIGGAIGLPFPGMNPNAGTFSMPPTATKTWLA